MIDSLKTGWRGSEFWLATFVAVAGVVLAARGQLWPGLVGAAVASAGYGVSRGLSKAAYSARGGSRARVV